MLGRGRLHVTVTIGASAGLIRGFAIPGTMATLTELDMSSTALTRALPLLLATSLILGCETGTGPRQRAFPELTPAQREVARASNSFAFSMLRQLTDGSPHSSVFFSPLSASMALGMTMNGARGETWEEMRLALGHQGLAEEEINAAYRDLMTLLVSHDRRVQLSIANSIWHELSFPVHDSFLDVARRYFDAEVTALDFGSPASLSTINGWVDRKTNGRIPKILDEIPPDVIMYLINAVYFKGDWSAAFDVSRTATRSFHAAGGERSVRMMMRQGTYPAARGNGWHAAELPYGAGDFAMLVVVPDQPNTLDALVDELDETAWNAIVTALSDQNGEVHLPKFRLEWTKVLNEPLKALGMRLAFGGGDLSRISDAAPLEITEVLQKTFVQVDELGTEAAAATSVRAGLTSAPPALLMADRPFVFAIRERSSGVILFLGALREPPQS